MRVTIGLTNSDRVALSLLLPSSKKSSSGLRRVTHSGPTFIRRHDPLPGDLRALVLQHIVPASGRERDVMVSWLLDIGESLVVLLIPRGRCRGNRCRVEMSIDRRRRGDKVPGDQRVSSLCTHAVEVVSSIPEISVTSQSPLVNHTGSDASTGLKNARWLYPSFGTISR